MGHQSQSKIILRWALFFPAAILAAWAAWIAVYFGNKLTLYVAQGIDPNSFLSRAFLETVSHIGMGYAFVYVGAKLAPMCHKQVAYILAGVGLVASGFFLFPSIMSGDYWSMWTCLSLMLSLGVTACSVSIGEVKL